MKIKYRLKSNLLIANFLIVFTTVNILTNVSEIYPLLKLLLICLLGFETIFLLSIFFSFRLLITDEYIESRFYFIRKKIYFKDYPEFIVRQFLNCMRKRLVIKTKRKKIVLWDFYEKPLEEIGEVIVLKRVDSFNVHKNSKENDT